MKSIKHTYLGQLCIQLMSDLHQRLRLGTHWASGKRGRDPTEAGSDDS